LILVFPKTLHICVDDIYDWKVNTDVLYGVHGTHNVERCMLLWGCDIYSYICQNIFKISLFAENDKFNKSGKLHGCNDV